MAVSRRPGLRQACARVRRVWGREGVVFAGAGERGAGAARSRVRALCRACRTSCVMIGPGMEKPRPGGSGLESEWAWVSSVRYSSIL